MCSTQAILYYTVKYVLQRRLPPFRFVQKRKLVAARGVVAPQLPRELPDQRDGAAHLGAGRAEVPASEEVAIATVHVSA